MLGRFKKPEVPLRVGLGLMYIYSGIDLVRHPTGWKWAITSLPQGLQDLIASLPLSLQNLTNTASGWEAFLKLQGIGELIIAAILLFWFLPKWTLKLVAFVITVEMAMILWLVDINLSTFRDIGLLGAGAALLLIAYKK